MFRRKEDEEIASQSQQSTPQSNFPPFNGFNPNQSELPAFESKPLPAAPSAAPASLNQAAVPTNIEPKQSPALVTAPLKPANAAPANPFSGNYVKVPSQTQSPAAIPSATTSNTQNINKIEGIEAERRLTVGYGITLTGEVSDCDRLVIYGKVNAKLNNVKFLQISDSGKFNGSASIDQAEVSGVFEGELKVKNNITITSTGRVNGKITYGSIEIRPGGKFTGEIIEDPEAKNTQGQESSAQKPSSEYYGLYNSETSSKSEAA